jgi:hypothetical protein
MLSLRNRNFSLLFRSCHPVLGWAEEGKGTFIQGCGSHGKVADTSVLEPTGFSPTAGQGEQDTRNAPVRRPGLLHLTLPGRL